MGARRRNSRDLLARILCGDYAVFTRFLRVDLGHGEAYLRRPDVAQLIENALLFFHAERYELRAWVVMPNHVHALFKVGEVSMENILESWKSYTANEANKLLGRGGRFWQPDYWDTYMRDAQHEVKAVRYIETNPVKAKLVREPRDWPWSSARFRDDYGPLILMDRRAAFQAGVGSKADELEEVPVRWLERICCGLEGRAPGLAAIGLVPCGSGRRLERQRDQLPDGVPLRRLPDVREPLRRVPVRSAPRSVS